MAHKYHESKAAFHGKKHHKIQHSRPESMHHESREERSGNRHMDSGAHGPELYSGAAARHAMERKDEGMIYENHNAIANLPQEVMIKPWPVEKGYIPEMLDDGISGIDRQMSLDNAQRRIGFGPKKI